MADVVAVDPFTGKALTVRDKSRDASWYEEGLKSKGVMPGMYGFSPHGDIYTSPYLPPGPSSTNNPAAQDRGNRAGPLVTGLTNPPNTAAMPIAKSTATPSAAFSKTVPDMRGVPFGIGSRDTVGQRTAGLGFRPPQMDNGAFGVPMSQTMAAMLGNDPAYSGQRGVQASAPANQVAQALIDRETQRLASAIRGGASPGTNTVIRTINQSADPSASRTELGKAMGDQIRKSATPSKTVTGSNNSFMPRSVQNSVRFQTGY